MVLRKIWMEYHQRYHSIVTTPYKKKEGLDLYLKSGAGWFKRWWTRIMLLEVERMRMLGALLIIAGTYFLSRNLFVAQIGRLENFKEQPERLPYPVRIPVILFGYWNKMKTTAFWMPKRGFLDFRSTLREQLKIAEPFIGFFLITIGTLLSLKD